MASALHISCSNSTGLLARTLNPVDWPNDPVKDIHIVKTELQAWKGPFHDNAYIDGFNWTGSKASAQYSTLHRSLGSCLDVADSLERLQATGFRYIGLPPAYMKLLPMGIASPGNMSQDEPPKIRLRAAKEFDVYFQLYDKFNQPVTSGKHLQLGLIV